MPLKLLTQLSGPLLLVLLSSCQSDDPRVGGQSTLPVNEMCPDSKLLSWYDAEDGAGDASDYIGSWSAQAALNSSAERDAGVGQKYSLTLHIAHQTSGAEEGEAEAPVTILFAIKHDIGVVYRGAGLLSAADGEAHLTLAGACTDALRTECSTNLAFTFTPQASRIYIRIEVPTDGGSHATDEFETIGAAKLCRRRAWVSPRW